MDSPCKEWPKVRNEKGYGREWDSESSRLDYAHRLAWKRKHGPIPKGICVLHKCDNPPCYNDEHLFLGTKKDNQRDMSRKGRSLKRELCGKGHVMSTNNRGQYCKICHNKIANKARDRRREMYHGTD